MAIWLAAASQARRSKGKVKRAGEGALQLRSGQAGATKGESMGRFEEGASTYGGRPYGRSEVLRNPARRWRSGHLQHFKGEKDAGLMAGP